MRERLFKLNFYNFHTRHFILLLTILSPSFFAQGKLMFTVKNFYDKVEASYEFTYTEN